MAAEVTRQIKSEGQTGIITRDFLGVCSSGIESKELDLDLHVPSGWEKRLDLKSGKVYIQRSYPANAASELTFSNQKSSKLYDSNAKPTLNLLEQPILDLKLVSNCPSSSYTSVCTLDKVKSALDRAERSSPSSSSSSSSRKRWMVSVGSQPKCSSSPSRSSSMSFKETEDEVEPAPDQTGLLVAGACPGCFLYVLVSKNDPKCPKCNSVVQLPIMMPAKKPKIDLNISM